MQFRFAETIQQRANDLTPSERRLVSSVLNEPRAAALASVTELARGAGVHEATVSRLARKLGFDGYPSFRQSLQAEFIPNEETAVRMKRTIDASGEAGVLGALVGREVEALARLTAHVTEAEIAAAAAILMAARRIFVYATGNAEILAQMMAKRLGRYGCDVHVLGGDARTLAEGVLGMTNADVLLAYSFRRAPRAWPVLAARAKEVGARTLAISGMTGHLLLPRPDQLLTAPRGGDAKDFQTLTVPMAISNAIVIAAGATEDTNVLQTLNSLGALIKRFE